MHACIAALSQGVPTVGLAYSGKFRGVFEALEMGDYALDLRRLGAGEILERGLDAYRQREQLCARLAARLPAVFGAIETTFEAIIDHHSAAAPCAAQSPEILLEDALRRG
jgi:polysaccharide pyruvyl transferase WcaK-like protein